MLTDSLRKHDGVAFGNHSIVYKPADEHSLRKEIDFYRCLLQRQDRCPDFVTCFLVLPNLLFLSYCSLNRLDPRYAKYQEREEKPNGLPGRLFAISSALEFLEKMGFCHNDLSPQNCLLDENLNLKLCESDCATTVGQFLEGVMAPWARELTAGPLRGSWADIACWHDVYPTMALIAYDIKRKTNDFTLEPEFIGIILMRQRVSCETNSFQPPWRRFIDLIQPHFHIYL
ncbi:hypothetical protein BDW69DRAFT_192941 [Aspergillus filifer]